jgi:hypothetical protein
MPVHTLATRRMCAARPNPLGGLLGDSRTPKPRAAGNDERVETDGCRHDDVGVHDDAAARRKSFSVEADDDDLVGRFRHRPVCFVEFGEGVGSECVGGPNQVERLHSVEPQKSNASSCHVARIAWRGR